MPVLTFAQIRRFWIGLCLVYLTFIVHFTIYLNASDQPSTSLKLLFVFVLCLSIGVAGITVAVTPTRIERLRSLAQPFRVPLTLIILVLLTVLGLGMRPEWLYAHLALVFTFFASVLYLTLYRNDQSLGNARLWPVVIAVLVGVTAIRIYGLTVYPNVFKPDEGWTLGWAASQAKYGYVSDFMVRDLDKEPTYWLPRYYSVMGVWLRLTGIGLWQARLFNVLVASLVIILTALAARQLYDTRTGILTAAALVVSSLLTVGFRIRHDIGVALAIACSLWLYSLAITRHKPVYHVLAGMAIGAGLFAHYHTIMFGPAVFVGFYLPLYLQRWTRRQWLPERGAWLYGLGMGMAMILVVLIQIAPDVRSFLAYQSPARPASVTEWTSTLTGQLSSLANVSRWDALLMIGGVVAALIRRKNADWVLLCTLVCCHLALTTLSHFETDYYLVPFAPLYGLIIGALLVHTLRKIVPHAPHLVLAVFFLMPSLGHVLREPVRHVVQREPLALPPLPAAAWVMDHVPLDTRILADHHYYVWLHEYDNFVSAAAMVCMSRDNPDCVSADPAILDNQDIDLVIVDRKLPHWWFVQQLAVSGDLRSHGFEQIMELPSEGDIVTIYQRTE
jgi:hypothetical protein